jgi:hypothetical protein
MITLCILVVFVCATPDFLDLAADLVWWKRLPFFVLGGRLWEGPKGHGEGRLVEWRGLQQGRTGVWGMASGSWISKRHDIHGTGIGLKTSSEAQIEEIHGTRTILNKSSDFHLERVLQQVVRILSAICVVCVFIMLVLLAMLLVSLVKWNICSNNAWCDWMHVSYSWMLLMNENVQSSWFRLYAMMSTYRNDWNWLM